MLIQAIKNLFTPDKVYINARNGIKVTRSVKMNGTININSYDSSGNPLKTIVRTPLEEFTYDPMNGNELLSGHVTTVLDHVAGTETSINRSQRQYERPLYDAFKPTETVVDPGGSIHYFHKFKKRINGPYIDSFNMSSNKNGYAGVKVLYNSAGEPVSAVKISSKKGKS